MSMTNDQIPFLERGQIEQRAKDVLSELPSLGISLDAFAISHHLGVPVHLIDFVDPDISGRLVRRQDRSEIHIRASDPYLRQNFTVAHELGHYVLHPHASWDDTFQTMYRRANWQGSSVTRRAEYQANLFAAALLMPETIVRERWDLLKSLAYLAPIFRVSKKAVFRRLEELGLIVPSVEGFSYLDISSLRDIDTIPELPRLSDNEGEIPTFLPVAVDEQGRIIPMRQEEQSARQIALDRVLKAAGNPSRIDPPELLEEPNI